MATLKELLEFKEYHANKVEKHADAVKFFDNAITEKVKEIANSNPRCAHVLIYGECTECKPKEEN